jgi:hypothetical protein
MYYPPRDCLACLTLPKNMKNTVTSYKPESNNLGSYRKEKSGLYKQYTLLNFERAYITAEGVPTYDQPVIIRVYWPAQTAYACAWISTKDSHAVGKGKAGGCGYCKQSAAVDNALRDAGIQLEHSIHGVGEGAIRGALAAIARYIGLTNWTVTEAHA